MEKHNSIPPFVERRSVQKSNKKALFVLLLFFIVVLVVLFFQSSLSEVQRVTISGNTLVSQEEILKASQFKVGSFFFSESGQDAKNRILAIPAIETAKVIKSFPGKISIEVQEHHIISYIVDKESTLHPVLDNGYILAEKSVNEIPNESCLLTGWENTKELPVVAKQLTLVDSVILSEISEIYRNPSENYPKQVTIFTRNGYEIHLEYNQLAEKLKQYPMLLQEVIDRDSEKGIFYLLGDVSRFQSYENALKEGDQREESNENASQDQ